MRTEQEVAPAASVDAWCSLRWTLWVQLGGPSEAEKALPSFAFVALAQARQQSGHTTRRSRVSENSPPSDTATTAASGGQQDRIPEHPQPIFAGLKYITDIPRLPPPRQQPGLFKKR